jgi:hypothetical protein
LKKVFDIRKKKTEKYPQDEGQMNSFQLEKIVMKGFIR